MEQNDEHLYGRWQETINLCNVECDRLNQATEEILIKKNRQEKRKRRSGCTFSLWTSPEKNDVPNQLV